MSCEGCGAPTRAEYKCRYCGGVRSDVEPILIIREGAVCIEDVLEWKPGAIIRCMDPHNDIRIVSGSSRVAE